MTDPGFWNRAAGDPPRHPPLGGDVTADVCIVGAGYTGLWTAWSLIDVDPSLSVVVVEADHVGAGASGRNGGWLSGLMPGDRRRMAAGPSGPEGVVAMQRRLIDAVAEVEKACADAGIDCDLHRGGTLAVARNRAQLARLRAELEEDRRWGLGPADRWELGPADVSERLRIAGALGGTFSPHCARIQPAELVRGLARVVTGRGVVVHERSPAVELAPGRVTTAGGTVRAPWVVRATEGYTAGLPGLHRTLLPMNSSILATDPLPADVWAAIGWDGAETVKDEAHAYVYLQRTVDGRIAIGGRGIPYRYGSRLGRVGETPAATAGLLQRSLVDLFPVLAGQEGRTVTWSGVLGVARDWCPAVGVERTGVGGLAWAGGYVGDGVSTSYLAGRTLADLITGRRSELTALPWVGHRSRKWEPEPARWLGVQAVYAMYRRADRDEAAHPDRDAPSRWSRWADRLSGR